MKNLVKTFALTALVFGLTFSALAIEKEKLNSAIIENVVDAYINTTVKGDVTYINELFAETFTQRFNTDYDQPTLSRSSYIKQLKNQKGITFQCDSKYEIVEQVGKYSLVKVNLDFVNFTRTDYVTLIDNDSGWEIAEVNTVYEQ